MVAGDVQAGAFCWLHEASCGDDHACHTNYGNMSWAAECKTSEEAQRLYSISSLDRTNSERKLLVVIWRDDFMFFSVQFSKD